MRPDPTAVTIRFVRPLAFHMRVLGIDATQLFADHGVPYPILFDSDARLSQAQLVALWRACEERTGDPDLGIHVLESIDLRLIDFTRQPTEYLLLHMFANSATVASGLERFAHSYAVAHREVKIDLAKTSHGVDVHYSLEGDSSRHLTEYFVGTIAQLIAATTGDDVAPKEVLFAHPAPKSTREHARVFRTQVRFGANFDGVRLTNAQLKTPLTTSRPALLRVVQRRVEEELEVYRRDELSESVRTFIRRSITTGNVSTAHVAEHLGMSVRTLARKLSASNTSHQKILDDVRRSLATRYLLDGTIAIGDIAVLLGFADPSTFDRAFRRWFTRSPREYREALNRKRPRVIE